MLRHDYLRGDTPQVVDEDEQQADRDQQILQEARWREKRQTKRIWDRFWAGGQFDFWCSQFHNQELFKGFSILMFNDVQFHSQGQFGMFIQCIFPSSSHPEDFHVSPRETSPLGKAHPLDTRSRSFGTMTLIWEPRWGPLVSWFL